METLPLSPEIVASYKMLLTTPAQYNLPFDPLKECFTPSDTVTAQHILYADYLKRINNDRDGLPKVIFYIIMNQTYGLPSGKDSKGNAGWPLQITAPKEQ